ncbi:Annexin [Viridothelium virens]|uniref:Annexin n=1 Tax=Viridothelium virens TaxID=1048519 RepID=A0A6A6HBW8_VIRVR|nr:Annexin [Viridothelium virens]
MPGPQDHSRHHSQSGPHEEQHIPYTAHPRKASNAGQGPGPRYANVAPWQYASVPADKLTFTSKSQTRQPPELPHTTRSPTELPHNVHPPEPFMHRPHMPFHSYSTGSGVSASANANIVEVTPGGFGGPEDDHLGVMPRMDRLSVGGNHAHTETIVPGALPPGSPMLEAYHGTYQSISPMPSPIMMPDAHDSDSDLDNFTLSPNAPLPTPEQFAGGTSASSRHRPKASRHRSSSSVSFATESATESATVGSKASVSSSKKRVQLYDAESDANALIAALGHRSAEADALIEILPRLSHDQMMELRNEYKRRCKVQGRGINIAKHIKLKTSGNFGKFCYVTALGRFESEAYWANFWYQSNGSRRELLIESLMGKGNAEVRLIKESFRDKRYNDSLVRCMDKELKADKFRTAVLLALEERRQEEGDVYSAEQVVRDADKLSECLKRREGGESAMLQIVVLRSDAHLREVLRAYERRYKDNFARAALKKSNNLVGEVIAHILNGVINRPARDALLLHHAISDISSHDKSVELRYELLVSRLVRLHWDRSHMQKVKREYKEKYGRSAEKELEAVGKGDWGDFALALLE